MTRPYVALVSDTAAFDPDTHSRWDLFPNSLTIRQSESQLAEVEMDVPQFTGDVSALSNRRILVSAKGILLSDGILSVVPRGLVGQALTLTAVGRPPHQETLDQQLAELADQTKIAPYYDPLFVPQGQENEWSEILAGRTEVLTYSRIQGAPSLSPMTSGASHLDVYPMAGSVEYEEGPGVAKRYGVRLEAKWKQLVSHELYDLGVFRGLETMTPEGIVSDFPKVGAQIGDGFTVVRSTARVATQFGKPKQRIAVFIEAPVGQDELDPAFIEEGTQEAFIDTYEMELELGVRYRTDVERNERAEFSVPVEIQPGAVLKKEEWEDLSLRDLTQADSAKPWQPNFQYEVGDEVVDGKYVYRARIAHLSGNDRTPGNWVQVGESEYLTSRRIASFFKSARGNRALRHAMLRVIARATAAARTVSVSFETKMPRRPWQITPNMTVGMSSPKLPGGFARGRLVEYALTWDRGRRSFSGRLACTPGLGAGGQQPSVGEAQGKVPTVRGRMAIAIEMAGEDQENRILEMTNGGASIPDEIPETVIRITTKPASSTRFEQEVSVPISGTIAFEEQART